MKSKMAGVLKVQDFKGIHPLSLIEEVNLLLYLNKNWKEEWGGNLELYSPNNLDEPVVKVTPEFNRCVIFNTTSYTYHGHPESFLVLRVVSRKSIALYSYANFFLTEKPKVGK